MAVSFRIEPRTIKVLRNFSKINARLHIDAANPGVITTTGGMIQAKAGRLQPFPFALAVENLPALVTTLSRFEEPMITSDGETLSASDAGRNEVRIEQPTDFE